MEAPAPRGRGGRGRGRGRGRGARPADGPAQSDAGAGGGGAGGEGAAVPMSPSRGRGASGAGSRGGRRAGAGPSRAPRVPTRAVVRHLPPALPEAVLRELVDGVSAGEYDHFYFEPGDLKLGPHAFARAYINFKTHEALVKFGSAMNNHIFRDSKGTEHRALVEYAPFQKIPRKRRVDQRQGTIERSADYAAFLEQLANPPAAPPRTADGIDAALAPGERPTTTPLLEYLWARKQHKGRPSKGPKPPRRGKKGEASPAPAKGAGRPPGSSRGKRGGGPSREGGESTDAPPRKPRDPRPKKARGSKAPPQGP